MGKTGRVYRSLTRQMISWNRKFGIKGYKLNFESECLYDHLERLFLPGMEFSNYGSWHVGHIRPKCMFSPYNDAEVEFCWSLSNLFPQWANDNWSRNSLDFRGDQLDFFTVGRPRKGFHYSDYFK
ncbi:hypothetical protein KAR91_69045 [Candidatus Pacearchaeota archaeon]|nr:hypothetical protein [Candidatus Pacearchaeota archaeon]